MFTRYVSCQAKALTSIVVSVIGCIVLLQTSHTVLSLVFIVLGVVIGVLSYAKFRWVTKGDIFYTNEGKMRRYFGPSLTCMNEIYIELRTEKII